MTTVFGLFELSSSDFKADRLQYSWALHASLCSSDQRTKTHYRLTEEGIGM